MTGTLLYVWSSNPKIPQVQPNVVVPYVNKNSTVFRTMRLNLTMQGITPRYERLDNKLSSDYAYDRLFRELWDKEEPFIIVEHDIFPWPGAIQQIWECEEPWCGYQYYVHGGLHSYLGCVKFNPKELGDCPLPSDKLHWAEIDMKVINELVNRGRDGHLHEPAVSHLNFGHHIITSVGGEMHPDLVFDN